MDIIKIKKSIEYYKTRCEKCEKEITGISLKQLKHNLKVHEIFCKKKKTKKEEKKQNGAKRIWRPNCWRIEKD